MSPIAVTDLQYQILGETNKYNINVGNRWSQGIEHHPMSEKIVKSLEAIDYLFTDNYFDWRIGGDGDNGETLMYELDILFDLWEARP
jgi:hypothetical protein